jgi:hypothetical protein
MTIGNATGLADGSGDADGVGESAGVSVADGPSEAGGTHVAIGVGLGDAPGVEFGEWLGVAACVPHAATTTATTAAAAKPRVKNIAPPRRDGLLRLTLCPLIFDPSHSQCQRRHGDAGARRVVSGRGEAGHSSSAPTG